MWSKRKPDMIILRENKPYIDRWFLIPRNRWFNIYLHHGLVSDYLTPHDHPWWNCSILLKGEYYEHQYFLYSGGMYASLELKRRWSRTVRKATQLHRIELIEGKPFWSLFITGPNVRDWGFQTHNGWISHTKVLDIDRIAGTSKVKPEYEKDWQ